jgi:hypothetical protein
VSAHVVDRLSLYLDGELAPAARTEVEAHVRGCSACARHLEELAAVDAAARELPVPEPPGYFDALPGRVRARLPARRRPAPPVWVWAVAAGLALAALTPLMLRQTASPVPETAHTDETAGVVEPPPTTAVAAPEEAPPAGAERAKTLAEAKDAAAPKSAPTPAPLRYERARENAAASRPSATGQVQKHGGPFAQAPAAAAPPARPPAAAAPAAARAEEMRADEAQVEAPPGEKLQRDQARRGGLSGVTITAAQAGDEATRFRALIAQRPASSAEARQLHDAWTAFAAAYPSSPRADEARVRAIEALALAWDKGGDPADQEGARRAALDYLAAAPAPQSARVRALLDHVSPPRP